MSTNDQTQDTTQTPAPDRERDPAGRTEPRGNQAPEQEWVQRGEEQLEKVSGN